MAQKAVKAVIEVQLHAVTCPGVFLQDKDDVYLSVSLFGQYKKSKCLRPVFPLLLHEKMTFKKVFPQAMDPAIMADMLECETVKFELIQLTPPGGEALAGYEEDVRRFLFPEPKLAPMLPGVDREVLMRRTPSFPGIAPKLEFSTKTVIAEFSRIADGHSGPRTSLEKSSRKVNIGKTQKLKSKPLKSRASATRRPATLKGRSHGKPAVEFRSRSLSPRLQRRPPEYSWKDMLCPLSLAPHTPVARREWDSRPRQETKDKPSRGSPAFLRRSRSRSVSPTLQPTTVTHRSSSSQRPQEQTLNDPEDNWTSTDTDELSDCISILNTKPAQKSPSNVPSLASTMRQSPSPAAGSSSPKQRAHGDNEYSWDLIHERVRRLLTSSGARERLHYVAPRPACHRSPPA
ncbi:spermatogenesis associated 6-like protein isoform X2 [Erpetoichthys calabaricus]|uniref:spermatogenesis associated 6-like protein isoform X2 n=1 Tax=Erpetoichthys calabaricus TaxID=27687 RepID=UPI0022341B34|nr:spermatogenesis associated 6-like protein isoform X2 [Erpetoichthys calabaricus]